MRQVLNNGQGVVTIGGAKISNVRFVTSQDKLQTLLDILEQTNEAYYLSMKYNKTKVIVDREHDNNGCITSMDQCQII